MFAPPFHPASIHSFIQPPFQPLARPSPASQSRRTFILLHTHIISSHAVCFSQLKPNAASLCEPIKRQHRSQRTLLMACVDISFLVWGRINFSVFMLIFLSCDRSMCAWSEMIRQHLHVGRDVVTLFHFIKIFLPFINLMSFTVWKKANVTTNGSAALNTRACFYLVQVSSC